MRRLAAVREIFRFELDYQVRSRLFWLSASFFFLISFGAITSDVVSLGGSIGNVNRNAPFVIMQTLAVMSVIGMFVTTAFVAGAVLRDYEHRTDGIFFSTPLRKTDYLLGRFGGAYVASVLIFVAVALAIALGSFMPWLEPERVGAFGAAPYLYAFTVFIVPNMFLTGALFFSAATLTRSMMGTYVSLVGFLVAWGVAGTLLSDIENDRLAALVDPFGLAPFQLATRYWTTTERNTLVLGLDPLLLQNRLIWVGVAAAVLAFALWRFTFTAREGRSARKERKKARAEQPSVDPSPPAVGPLPTPARDFSASGVRSQFVHQTRFEAVEVLRGLPFVILLAMGMLNLIGNSAVLDQLFGTPVYPRTHLMIDVIQGGFLLFAGIILTFYSGELVWRERGRGMDEVQDALPVPNQVLWGAKAVALVAVLAVVLAVAVLTSIGIQLYRGYTNVELGLYARGIGLLVGIPFLLIAVLALFAQVATNNKFVGYLVVVLYFVSIPVLNAVDLEHNLYKYAANPGAPYSDMNGYGHFVEAVAWFDLYWAFGAVLLLVGVHLLWVRGKETGFRTRLALARQRLTGTVRGVALAGAMGFVATGSWIFYNTNVLNEYRTTDELQDLQADYEKRYKPLAELPQPRITGVFAEVDIYPAERSADIRGTYRIRNKTGVALDSLHMSWSPLAMDTIELAVPGGEIVMDDPEMGYRIYRLASALAPGDELEVGYRVAVRTRGFVNGGSNTQLVENGSFFNSGQYFPHIGYNRQFELGDPVERRRRGLPPIERFPSVYDSTRYGSNYITSESDWIDFETVVSTSADQVALAPGYLEREWEEGGRRYFHYRMDAPILGFWAYLSGRWEVARDRWNDVEIAVYHHPDHPYNVERMIESTKASLDYFTREFGPYQHRQVRIIEFPRYARFAQAFPNTIPFSESIGFIARLDDPDDIDYVYYVTAHEVAHQWWAHQVMGAGVQGATITSETMAQYSALMVMEKEYGTEKMRRFLRYELDSYLRGRGGELIEELPLFLVENQPYIHYRKGSLVTYALRDYVGEEAYNAALARYVDDVKFSGPPYTTSLDYLDYVSEAVPEERRGLLEDLFRTITLWELRAPHGTWERRPDGKYAVRLSVDAHKFRADGQGVETEIPMDDWVDVGVFGATGEDAPPEGKVLYLMKHRIASGDSAVIELVVDEEPRQAGIDPFSKLIDRNPDNNLVRLTTGG